MTQVMVTLPSAVQMVLLVAAAFGSAVLSGVAGFGGGVLMVPILVTALGPRNAIVVVTISQLASNGGRAWFNRTEIDRRLVGVCCLGGVPGAVAGSLLVTATPLDTHTRVIGGFLLALVLWRRLRPAAVHVPDPVFVVMNGLSGLGSGLVGSFGPLITPFFLARGLVRGAYIGTDAAAQLMVHITKLVVFGAVALLTVSTGLVGLVLVPPSIAGAWLGKQIVDRMPVGVFVAVVEIALVASGVFLLVHGRS
ncbi:sulfite exporter TauE/SafE family protein [Nonomuraea sp. CA-141351]|uniref:sulfite exporter TauE/SafE family protein n=1 Tax=Nonomuraea sp. CA-141351 TaxID=3239996 RepID=UPI003D8C04A3